ncbi:MAG: twin-arginine translocation signal domain-containing protein, partial [Terriglobales bacterium]
MKRRDFIGLTAASAGALLLGVDGRATTVDASTLLDQTSDQRSLSFNSWTITVDSHRGLLNISHDRLGIIMKDVRLNLRTKEGPQILQEWVLENKGDNQ